MKYRYALCFCLLSALSVRSEEPLAFSDEREQVWTVLTNRFYCPKTEALYDVLWRDGRGRVSATACLPTPEEIRRQYPNPCAWGTGMQDCVFNGGPFLSAAVSRGDLGMARSAYRGIRRCATVSGVRGFVARGVSPEDGQSFYIDSSRDTWTLFIYHLRAFANSAFCDEATRREVRGLIVDVADYAERCVVATNGFSLLRADGRPGLVSRMWFPLRTHETLRLPMIYAAAADLTGDRHWRDLKLRYIDKALDGAEGPLDDDIRGSELNQMQLSVRILWETEDDPLRKERLLRLLKRGAELAAGPLTARLEKSFGTTQWHFAKPMEDWRRFPWRRRWSCDSAVFHGYRYDVPDSGVATVEDGLVEAAYAVLVQAQAPGRPVDKHTLDFFRRAIKATDLSAAACANIVNVLLAMDVADGKCPKGSDAPNVCSWRPKERWRGVNIIGMFNRRGEPSASGFPDSSCGFKEEHFQWVKELGFNFVRLPLDYRNWCPDGTPDEIDEAGLKEVDRGVAFGRKYGLHVQICFHHAPGYCILGWKNEPMTLHKDPKKLAAFCRHWAMFARRYRDVPNDELTFNLLNEPGGISNEEYERIFGAAIAAIRKEDPKRFVMLDGTNIGLDPVPAFFGKPLVGQAMRGYAPGGISHYGVHWALRPQTEPMWPLTVESPTMPWIYGPEHEKSRTLVIDNAPAGEWVWDFSPADDAVELEVLANGRPVASHAYAAKQHELFKMRLAHSAGRVEIRPKGRGASRFGLLTIRSDDGGKTVRLGGWCQDANIANRSEGDNLHQRFMGWNEEFPFRLAANVGKPIEHRGGTTGMDALEKFNFAPWKQASDKGAFCFVGEFGCFNKTPHPIALAWLEDQLKYFKKQGWGWSLWLMNGSFGFIDSGREDVEYEDFHGHKLDRKMLALLQKY